MPKCPICNSDVPMVGKILLMKRDLYCKKCGAKTRVIPRSVVLVSGVGITITAMLGAIAGAGNPKTPLLVLLLIWIAIFLVLYIKSAKLKVIESNDGNKK